MIASARQASILAVAVALGAKLVRRGQEAIGPCPCCGGQDRFSVNLRRQIYNCRGCANGGDVIALVQHITGCDFMSAIAFLEGNAALPAFMSNGSATSRQAERQDNLRAAQQIWLQAGDPRGTTAEQYLRQRGLSISDEMAGDVLRFHGRLHLESQYCGGLIALFRDLKTNEPRGIQRTFLAPDGSKIGRRMLGPVKDAAIKLDADAEVTAGLHIGEGLETCLAARELGFCPAWAVGSAGGIRAFPVLTAIDCLSILIETDDTGANRSAAGACARRWQEAGREVLMVVPQLEGDMNDVLLKVSL